MSVRYLCAGIDYRPSQPASQPPTTQPASPSRPGACVVCVRGWLGPHDSRPTSCEAGGMDASAGLAAFFRIPSYNVLRCSTQPQSTNTNAWVGGRGCVFLSGWGGRREGTEGGGQCWFRQLCSQPRRSVVGPVITAVNTEGAFPSFPAKSFRLLAQVHLILSDFWLLVFSPRAAQRTVDGPLRNGAAASNRWRAQVRRCAVTRARPDRRVAPNEQRPARQPPPTRQRRARVRRCAIAANPHHCAPARSNEQRSGRTRACPRGA